MIKLGTYEIGQEVRETKARGRRQGVVVEVDPVSGRVRVSWTERESWRIPGVWDEFGRNLRTWVSPKTITHVIRGTTDAFAEPVDLTK